MSKQASITRARIVETADRLFYEHGYGHTSFADIAAAVELSRGNFYYHFKTKDEILAAVIELRRQKTQAMLDAWAAETALPAARIGHFIDMMAMNAPAIRRNGCPVGTLCTELAKLEHPALPQANTLLTLFRDWLRSQFAQLGTKAAADADGLAMHLLARSQGIATLANAFDDGAFIQHEVSQLHQWLYLISK
ncbi:MULTISPECIES: TetR/AcrR family transcriptional regulator [unclassified Duganella]|uniref:TetR/AcrR family transcriptional regulator n=1 Tax=unclassified Duganella TaxID=2636909 RepID=UPI0006FAD26E|nr:MULTISPECIES: TetR/AcrR family transcriptional regulator [unclassified Duganella]KQV46496.1 transcriptional regulator [Duganella sp. Root336D2]KRC02288.1 transcriptional regulator [Duganella sp. Root198D2]